MPDIFKVRRKGGAVRVTLPVSVAYDIKQMQKVIANLADKLGHSGCFSGFDIFFEMEKNFRVNPKSLEFEGNI